MTQVVSLYSAFFTSSQINKLCVRSILKILEYISFPISFLHHMFSWSLILKHCLCPHKVQFTVCQTSLSFLNSSKVLPYPTHARCFMGLQWIGAQTCPYYLIRSTELGVLKCHTFDSSRLFNLARRLWGACQSFYVGCRKLSILWFIMRLVY